MQGKKFYKIKKYGNVIKMQVTTFKSYGGQCVQKLNDKDYVDLRTGEVLQYKRKAKSRIENAYYLYKTFESAREMINANFQGEKNVRFITLTYKENMTDCKQLMRDFDVFRKKMVRKYNKFTYFAAVEAQGRGAWHIHMFVKWSKMPYIKAKDLETIWGNGFVKIQRVDEIDNLGAYLTAYLTGGGKSTAKKLERLALYPAGMKIFRHSSDVKKITYQPSDQEELNKLLENNQLTYQSIKEIDKVGFVYDYYFSTKEKPCQEQKERVFGNEECRIT